MGSRDLDLALFHVLRLNVLLKLEVKVERLNGGPKA